MTRALQLSNSCAAEDIKDAAILEDMGVEPWSELARCMANLDVACRQMKILYSVRPSLPVYALEAVLTALSQYQTKATAFRSTLIFEECEEAATEEHAEGMRGLARARTA